MKATVWASGGANVNLRSFPSKTAPLVDQVPIGDTVTVYEQSGDWHWVSWHGKPGYMMSQFLRFDGQDPAQPAQDDMITVSRQKLVTLMQTLQDILEMKGGA